MDETVMEMKDSKGKALASLILGVIGVVAWLLPLVGVPVTLTGFILGILGRKSSRKSMAFIGIVLCGLFLIISVVNAGLGAYLAVQSLNK